MPGGAVRCRLVAQQGPLAAAQGRANLLEHPSRGLDFAAAVQLREHGEGVKLGAVLGREPDTLAGALELGSELEVGSQPREADPVLAATGLCGLTRPQRRATNLASRCLARDSRLR